MILNPLIYIRAEWLAQALLTKLDDTDPRVRAVLAESLREHDDINEMTRYVAKHVRDADPVTVTEIKRAVKPFDIQCKKWDQKRTRRRKQEPPEPAVDMSEPAPRMGDVQP